MLILKADRGFKCELDLNTLNPISETPTSSKRRKFCVQQNSEKTLYDLTVIPLYPLSTAANCYSLVNEKNIYISLDHELIPNLLYSVVDGNMLYFLHPHIHGCTLKELLPVSEDITKFLISWLFLTINYLHQRNIAHRNISTNNVIIGSSWLPYLTDFSCAIFTTNRTYSQVTDPYYRSPEMILGKGYTKSTDIWSIGVILYELIYRNLPFGIRDTDSPMEAYAKILHAKPRLDAVENLKSVNDLISHLLVDESKRYEFDAIKDSAWIANFNFYGLNLAENELPGIIGKSILASNDQIKIQDLVKTVIVI